ncbi:MFS transporter [Colwellia sp. MB02u-18]|nr:MULTISPECIES: MFS transporter [unclassified Colwellia]MBA6224189.1 MFS transporter [Colwellia sp. MB3u-45]MBA6268319.1 MFS transporter [Colwellia sp. MB3u-43]MBA6322729.1 MFS transporter [Colwellia sp. MB02u-19]MBA6323521.1 MFS transporter [Colwellia sp. MB02u-18]MBA6332872.1 MFS transporter [Colwellia sp. MB02u-12]
MSAKNSSRIFTICCLALLVTSMTFAIRAGILSQLGAEFSLNDGQLGWVNAMAFLGFPVAMMIGGALYNSLGAKKLLIIAFVCHLAGLLLTISAEGFWGLLISTFFIGFANGAVEAGCNPLIAETYPDNKTTMLNRFHVWFPGGIVVGALISKAMTDASLGWQLQIAVMLIPAIIYGVMTLKQQFPEIERIKGSTRDNVKALFSPLFIFIAICMTLTTTAELGTQQWIERILGSSGASPMLIMALITGLMAVGRYFAGPVIHRLNPVGVLLFSAIVATAGIYAMSIATGSMVYFAAILFAIGVMYFWPTMVGFVAENIPESGALGMSMIGAAGMFALSLWNPVIGSWIDSARAKANASIVAGVDPELVAGQSVLANLTIFPAILIIAFTFLYLYMNKNKSRTVVTAEIN